MIKNQRLVITGVMSAVALGSLFVAFSGKGQSSRSAPTNDQVPFGRAAKELDDAASPIVDFDNPGPVEPTEKIARKLKNARHDRQSFVLREPYAHAGEVIREPEWRSGEGPSDLPADQSDLVVEGVVADSKAFLSEDKTGVYSEFTLGVTRIVKVASGFSVNVGDMIVTERFGGRVRYPSGQVVLYRIAGQGVPMMGKKYLFFLSKADQDSYKLLTAYEIQGQRIYSLDGSRINFRGRGDSVFDKHNGEDLNNFMGKVGRAINGSQSGGHQP
jgi:hypothetical protein